ncbi:MAG: hypothetical protein GY940_01450 [bacterium]|nr:hypothetical protein [bacterium]
MTFEKDIFISYAHIDNLSLKSGEHGWIENFHRALEVRLSQLMGEKPAIWRDQKLQGNDFFGDEIVEQFPKTAVMISILSPRYLKSEWCTKEITEFAQVAKETIGTKIGNKSRIFKIIKTAVPYDAHPSEVADTLGYEFYITDPQTGRVKELNQAVTSDLEQTYWTKLDDIAHDICSLLEKVKSEGETGMVMREDPESQLTVYLAETSSELKEQRDSIKRQLIEYGYRVLPDTRPPLTESEFIAAVKEHIEPCVLSIHLVGEQFGIVPEGSKKSIVMLQNELTALESKTGKLKRLIWLMAGKPDKGGRQEKFINHLRSSPYAQVGADLFETSIEDFKLAVQEKLEEIQATASAGKKAFQNISTVYLAVTNMELQETREKIKQRLIELGCTVFPEQWLPLVYEDLRENVVGLLGKCDASIHLLGDHYGLVPEETDKSLDLIQNELAEEKSKTGQLERLVWFSPVVINHTDERQRSFMDNIKKTDPAKQPHTHMFETPIDEIESAVFERLEKIDEERKQAKAEEAVSPGGAETGEAEHGPPLIYLICDQGDLENQDNDDVMKLEDFLFDSGFEVVLPVFEGEEEDVMNDHHENLKTCNAVVIYYGGGNQLWLRSITRDLSKIAGYGRTRSLEAKAVFLGPPASRQKEHFRSHGVLIINGFTGFSPALMDPFIEHLKEAEK